jgi:hypothetical protein
MKNLIYESPEIAEDLPNRAKVRPCGVWREYGKDYPWKKVYRFLVSRVGKPWDRVFSEYVHLDWIPRQYRIQGQIAYSVIFDTFMKDGKVWYYDKHYANHERQIEDCGNGFWSHSDIFYIHPETKYLCYYKPKKINYKKRQSEEEAKTLRILGDYHQLVKLNGIWYEVKGKPQPPNTYTNYINGRAVVVTYKWGNPIGPKDRMIEDNTIKSMFYYPRNINYGSVKIILRRQLNHKELKKYGVKNN